MTTSVFLNNDRTMPLLGLGLYKTTDAVEAEDAIAAAVQNGYRLLSIFSYYILDKPKQKMYNEFN